MEKPYIQLDQQYPGIVSLFMFDKGVSKHLSGFAQEIMRRPSPLSVGERELIAAFVSKLNECEFCYKSHSSCAFETLNHPEWVQEVINEEYVEGLPMKLRSLLCIAADVQSLDREHLPISTRWAKEQGATDQEIHDTVIVASFFCMCNRYVDGLGTTFVPGEEVQGGKSLAKYGYLMTIRRFFGEILPKLLKR
jgi:uncharacterized peroxidase-related enzyme